MKRRLGTQNVSGADNPAAAARADIVVLPIPYAVQRATAQAIAPDLAGKILIDATVPLVPPKVSHVQLPEGGSAVAALKDMLGSEVRVVVAAFQNVSAHSLDDLDHDVECDLLVCGDDVEARETAIALAAAMGLRGIHAGPICNAAGVEH